MSRKIKHNLVIIGFIFSVRNKGVLILKERILFIGVFLVIMAMLPAVAVKCSSVANNSDPAIATNDNANENNSTKTDDKNKILCGLVAAQYKDNYCDETLKAIAILINTDYSLNPDSFDINDKEQCIFEEDSNNSLRENYSKIENIVNSVSEIKININNGIKYIPYYDTSNGNTVDSEKYDYLCSVASPWDCYTESYSESTECIGVSISGVDYLCQNGADAEDALKWYLPKFKIS